MAKNAEKLLIAVATIYTSHIIDFVLQALSETFINLCIKTCREVQASFKLNISISRTHGYRLYTFSFSHLKQISFLRLCARCSTYLMAVLRGDDNLLSKVPLEIREFHFHKMSNAPSKIFHCGHFKFKRLFDTADIV